MIIKNGQVVLFENDDVIIKKLDIQIENGKIIKIKEDINPQENEKIIDAEDKVVMPGLINTHCHIPMSIFRGTFEGCNLYTWLNEKIWPIEDTLTKQDIYDASMLSFIEMISTGTTCVNDQYFMTEEIRKAAREMKIRAVLTRTLMDIGNEDGLQKRIDEFRELYETRDKQDDLITYTVAPHGLYTCSKNCLEQAKKLAKEYSLPIHVHFLESINEIEDIKKIHGKDGTSVIKEHFNDIPLILAHGVKLTNEDIEILKTMNVRNSTQSNLKFTIRMQNSRCNKIFKSRN